MRLILSLALLLACSPGLGAQERASPPRPVSPAAGVAAEVQPAASLLMPPEPAVEQSPAAAETEARRTAPIFDREFVRHVAAMVIAGVLVAVILRAIF